MLYKHVLALVISMKTLYIFPTELKAVKFFLKSRNAKYFIISLNNHTTPIHTSLIGKLNSSCNGLRLPIKRACKWTCKGLAGLPYKLASSPFGVCA